MMTAMMDVTKATRGQTKMAGGPEWTLWRGCISVLLMQCLTGLTHGTHDSNGVATRKAPRNSYAKKAVDYSSSVVSTAQSGGLRTKTSWAGLDTYYRTYTDQYTAYSKSRAATNIKLTSAPTNAGDNVGVCINMEQLDALDNSSYLGVFLCPLPFEPLQNTYCCGNQFAEYCCEPYESIMSQIVGPVIVVPLFTFVMIIWFWACCCKKKEAKEDEEPMQGQVNEGQQPEEVKVVSRPPSKTKEDRASPGGRSENQTSCTSLGSDGDNGYGSGPLAETKPLDPAYPPANEEEDDLGQRSPTGQRQKTPDYPEKDVSDNKEPKSKKKMADDEVADFNVSDRSLYEEQIL